MGITTLDGLGLLDDLFALSKDKFDVARVGHVWVDLYVSNQFLYVRIAGAAKI